MAGRRGAPSAGRHPARTGPGRRLLQPENGQAVGEAGAVLEQVQVLAQLPDTRMHDLRHTFASHAVRGAETTPMIGRLLGHSSLATTARYTHLNDQCLLQAAAQAGLPYREMDVSAAC